MLALTSAIYTLLAGDATLTAMLATYGGGPAIFTTDPAPDDAALPYIVTAGDVADSPWDTKTSRGRDIRRDIRCYTAATGSAALVEQIADRVRVLLHRATFPIDGHMVVVADVSGPFNGPAEDTAYGRVLTPRFKIEEQ